jgi:hypothetical protein
VLCFLFCLSSSCVPYVARFSGLSISDCPFGIRFNYSCICLYYLYYENEIIYNDVKAVRRTMIRIILHRLWLLSWYSYCYYESY